MDPSSGSAVGLFLANAPPFQVLIPLLNLW